MTTHEGLVIIKPGSFQTALNLPCMALSSESESSKPGSVFTLTPTMKMYKT